MYINNKSQIYYLLKINFQRIEQNILEIQKKIYISAKRHKLDNIYKSQANLILKKEFFLLIISKVLFIIKKKLV